MLSKNLRQNPGRVRAIIYAVLVHAVVIGIAVIGFRWTVDSPSTDEIVQATAVPEPPPRKAEKVDKRAQEEEAERLKAEAEKRREEELKKQKEEEEAKQRLVAERKKKEAEELARAKEKEKEQEKERQKRAAAEAERKKEEKRRQQAAEQTLKEQLAAEEKAREQAAFAARAATEIDKYRLLIRQRVSSNWNRPGGATKGLKCVVKVRLTPTGQVLSANVVTSSGNGLFDRSVENAVYKAAPLPLPEDPALYENFREIEFLFNPEE